MARGLKFCIKKEEGLYYLCRENKGPDQLHDDGATDLRLCFCICKKAMFLMKWLICACNIVHCHSIEISIEQNQLSCIVRKPDFCICENKDADQLRGNREADQRLCFRYMDSTIPLLPKSKISSL